MLLLLFAFISGLVTIAAPCIWPLLPVVLSASLAGEKNIWRPLGICLGLMGGFAFFTLALAILVRLLHLDPSGLRLLAMWVIGLLGISMVIPQLGARLEVVLSRFSSRFGHPRDQRTGFWPGVLTGWALGIVWSPCAGPILATIAALAATGKVTLFVVLMTLTYVAGVGIPLFVMAYGGQRLIGRTRRLGRYTKLLRQGFGVVMILAAVALYTNYAQTLQLQLLNEFPALATALNGFESSPVVEQQLSQLQGKSSALAAVVPGLFNVNQPAPAITGIDHWLNTNQPLRLADLRGKVVLVDFWTYTCINCLRTLPHVTSWYDQYHSQGLEVIGVHTPEFAFEKETQNVQNAINQFKIHYPVAQDNNYATWNNFNNEYWPAEYLIDAKGIIRRTDFGEGGYDEMEQAIRALLLEAGQTVTATVTTLPDQTPQTRLTPETYFGSSRAQYYYPDGSLGNGTRQFTLSSNPASGTFSLGGSWGIAGEFAEAGEKATLSENFLASKVFIILRPGTATGGKVNVYLDGNRIDPLRAGSDVQNSAVILDRDRLYNLVDLRGKTEQHVLRLEFETPGILAYTFTFG